jgi:polysaccharide biosynthesis transport protein
MNGRMEANLPETPEGPPVGEPIEGLSESLFEILWRRRWTVLLTTVVALAAGFVYLQRATPQYTSTSRVYVEQAGPAPLERDSSGTVTRWSNYLYTQAELIRRTKTLSAALNAPGSGRLRTFAEVSNPVADLRRGLDVMVGKKDEIIDVSFTCPYPDEAAHIVNSVVDAYITAHNERTQDTSAEELKILRAERAERDQELTEKLQEMAAFELEHENLAYGTERDGNIILEALRVLQSELTEARLATRKLKSEYTMVQEMAADPAELRSFVENQRGQGIYIVPTNEMTALRTELLALERRRADCLQQLKPDAPAITALDAEIERLSEQMVTRDKEFTQTQLAVAEKEYVAAQDWEEQAEGLFEEKSLEAVELKDQLVAYALKSSEYDQVKGFCDRLDELIRAGSVDRQVASINVEIIEAAEPATEPSEPQKARTMGLALCLGLFAGVGLGLLREWKDQRLRSSQEISALLGLPILGVVPAMGVPKQTVSIRGQKVRISPDSREAEAYRTVRTAVFFGAPKDEARTILVTSPAPGEGKSTAVSNLAIAMAQAGQKTLVVDADFRRPMQHRIFGLDRRAKGLSRVLAEQMTMAEAIDHTGLENLDVLTCGPQVPNPAELLNSKRFAQIVESLAEQYDRVLIDSPPVVAVTDAQILAALCAVTVLVLRAQVSTRRVSIQACESLLSVDAHLLGVVVNDVSRKCDRYGYSSGYGHYSYNYNDRNGGNGHRQRDIPIEEIQRRPSRRQKKYAKKLQAGLIPDSKPDRSGWIARG